MNELDRTKFLGGSDAAGVLGLSRWSSPLYVWALKTGQIQPKEDDTLQQKLGRKLEDVVADLFTEETGKKVSRVNETLFHKEYPFIGANIDRRIVGEDAGLEIKTASAWKSKEWQGEEIPREYVIQCLHYLAVTGKKRWYLAVLIGNQEFKWKVIEKDPKVIKDLIGREVTFWNDFVIPQIMPTVITKHDSDTLSELFPLAEEGKEITVDHADQLIENLGGFKEDLKQLEGFINQHENELKALLKDAESAVTASGKYRIYWSNQERKGFNVKKFQNDHPGFYQEYAEVKKTRYFRYKEIKGVGNGHD